MKILKFIKKYLFQILQICTVLLSLSSIAMFYLVNTHAVNHEVEMMFVSRAEKSAIAAQVNNFKFINEAFGEETARLNYIKIMTDKNIVPEVKKIVRLAYAEYLKE